MHDNFIQQRGLSLFTLVAWGSAVVIALVYARAFVEIPYTKYKVDRILSGILKEGNTKPSDIKSLFNSRIMFEGLGKVVNADNLSIDVTDKGVTVKADYEHCEPLWKGWTVCSESVIEKKQ